MTATLCLLCGNKRIETVCGDQSCPCTGGASFSGIRPVIMAGVGYKGADGRIWTVQKCGRSVPDPPRRPHADKLST